MLSTENQSIIVTPPKLDKPTVVIRAEVVTQVHQLVSQGIDLKIESPSDLQAGNVLFTEIHKLAQSIEAERQKVKKPVLDFGRAIDEAASPMLLTLKDSKQEVGAKIKTYENRIARERAEAERKAAEERRRLEERSRKTESPRQAQALKKAAEATTVPAPAALPKSIVRTRTEYSLVIDDLEMIPVKISNIRCLVPDERTILDLLKKKIAVPGCRLIETERTTA